MAEQILPPEGGTLTNDTLPIVTDDDVMAILPAYMRAADNAPVRDAIVAALRVMATTYQEAASYAARQRDVITATGDELDSLLNTRRHDDESDEDYRIRGLGLREVVTPSAICAAVNVIIAPYVCSYIEPDLDQFFLNGNPFTSHWGCFFGAAPQYPDRLYPDDAAANGGVVKPNVNPGPAGIYNLSGDGRRFELQIPDLSGLNESIVLIFSGTKLAPSDADVPENGGAQTLEFGNGESLGGNGLFAMDNTVGTDPTGRGYLFSHTLSENATYDQIIDVVERLRGGGYKWSLVVR